jgi:hypothetical protein
VSNKNVTLTALVVSVLFSTCVDGADDVYGIVAARVREFGCLIGTSLLSPFLFLLSSPPILSFYSTHSLIQPTSSKRALPPFLSLYLI